MVWWFYFKMWQFVANVKWIFYFLWKMIAELINDLFDMIFLFIWFIKYFFFLLSYICKCSNDTYNRVSVPFLPFSFRPLAGNNSAFWYKPDIFITLIANFTFAFHVDQFQHKKEITFNPIGIIKIAADRQNQLY